uniref:uncharacterized protein LOC106997902 isoform X2 n=1 Tax=Macaca mulatta TaxID=9544 RepID=UPI0010A208A5|nr:uncharacterized protein LOC106997902 isoform X2 [Macaca mulatta]
MHISWSRLNMSAVSPTGRSGCGLCRDSSIPGGVCALPQQRGKVPGGGGAGVEESPGMETARRTSWATCGVCWTPTADTTVGFCSPQRRGAHSEPAQSKMLSGVGGLCWACSSLGPGCSSTSGIRKDTLDFSQQAPELKVILRKNL